MKWERPSAPTGKTITETGWRATIPVVDALPALDRTGLGDDAYFTTHNHHWNARGHLVAATALAEFLLGSGLVPSNRAGPPPSAPEGSAAGPR